MCHRDVQPVAVVIAQVLPVDRPRAFGDRLQRLHVGKSIRRDLSLVRRHHRRDRRAAAFQPDEDKALPDLVFDRHQPGGQRHGVARPRRHAAQPPVEFIDPGVVRADQLLRATAGAVATSRDPRWRQTLVKAAISPLSPRTTTMLSPRYSSVCQLPTTGKSLTMADDLPGRTDDPGHLVPIEFGVVVPASRAGYSLRSGS